MSAYDSIFFPHVSQTLNFQLRRSQLTYVTLTTGVYSLGQSSAVASVVAPFHSILSRLCLRMPLCGPQRQYPVPFWGKDR